MNHDEIIFLEPYYDVKIWGGKKLKKFGFNIPSEKTGEAWLISAIKGKSSIVTNPNYNKMNLYDFNSTFLARFANSSL